MISTLTIFNAAYSGLDAYFPAGSEFQVDSPVVLIVGPNGSGKTGLMRMIASSLEYHRYFEEQAISHRWIETLGFCPSMEKAISEISQAREVSPGWFAVPYDLEKLTDFLAYRDSRFTIDLTKDKKEFSNERGEYRQYGVVTCGFTAISKQVLDQLVQARKMLSEDTLLNRWGYVQMHLDKNPLFLQEFVLPHDSETVQQEKIGVHRYCAFDPTFDGDMIIDFTKNFPMGTEEMKKFGMDIPKPRPFKSSPGQSLLGELERAFARIDRFFVSHINSVWKERDYSLQGRIDDVFSLGMKKEPVEEVPPGSSLAVFMDEPTIYLDYRNKKKFLGQVQELGRKYAGRLQFFIPTNDAVLIEHAQDCTYIDLYQQPAQAVKCLTLS